MTDMDCIKRVDEMAAESLCPDSHDKWETVRDELLKTRRSLTAKSCTHDSWIKKGKRFKCESCGEVSP